MNGGINDNGPPFQAILLDQIHDLVTATDLAGRITYVNDAVCQAVGRRREELIGDHISTFGEDPQRGARQQDIVHLTLTLGQWRGVVVNIGQNGEPILLDCRTRLLHDENGQPTGMVGISSDITQAKQREQELGRLAEAVRQASEGIVVTDPAGRIQYANPAFETITGYPAGEVTGKNPRFLKSGRHDQTFYQRLWQTILGGSRWTGVLVNKRKDGSLYTADCSISPMKNEKGQVTQFVWITRDISDAVALEKRIAQAQQMEAIGTLAGGIAHDFNNLLFPIFGLSELMMEEMPETSPYRENMRAILKAARRGRDLVKQILSFSRNVEPKKRPILVQPVLKEVYKLARSTMPTNIAIHQHIESHCGTVMADPTQLHQLTMNLITNAYHAVEKGTGQIAFELEEAEVNTAHATGLTIGPGRYAVIRVSDTGDGIDPELMDKIFEPYFTTKELGKGTGLGLSVVYGIVKDHGGDIRVVSERGKGCTFSVYLPLVKNSHASDRPEPQEVLERGTERILLLDDEEPIVRLEKMMLERLGYHVTACTSSIEAMKVFKTNPGDFDLVITDMAMPDMTGDRLAGELVAIRPDIAIVICTGFSETIDDANAREMGIAGFLMKPVVKSDLARTVRRVLDKTTGNALEAN